MKRHRAQLLICHERIAGAKTIHEGRMVNGWQYCQLAAYAWCFDCDIYVCDIHHVSQHIGHRTQLEASRR